MTDPELFLFDIDGTLLRGSTQVHRQAFAEVFKSFYGIDTSLDGLQAAGRTDTWLFEEPLRHAGLPESDIRKCMPEAFKAMEAYVDQHLDDLHDKVLPGVRQVLAALDEDGALLGLLTGNLRGIAFAKMRKAGLAQYFDTGGFGGESVDRAHLVPVALRHAGEATGHTIQPGRAVVIGDTPLDIAAGANCGTKTVGVATGPFSLEQLAEAGADLVLSSLDEPDMAARLKSLLTAETG